MEDRIPRAIIGGLVGSVVSMPLTVLVVLIRQSIKPFDAGMLLIGGILFAILLIPLFISIFGGAAGVIAGFAKNVNPVLQALFTLPVGLIIVWIYADYASQFNYADKMDYWLQLFIGVSSAVFVLPCAAVLTNFILSKVKFLDSDSLS